MINQVVITTLGDRVTTKIYQDSHGLREDITIEMASPQTFEFETERIRSTKQDRQKLWPGRG